jgi:hypothetical protein
MMIYGVGPGPAPAFQSKATLSYHTPNRTEAEEEEEEAPKPQKTLQKAATKALRKAFENIAAALGSDINDEPDRPAFPVAKRKVDQVPKNFDVPAAEPRPLQPLPTPSVTLPPLPPVPVPEIQPSKFSKEPSGKQRSGVASAAAAGAVAGAAAGAAAADAVAKHALRGVAKMPPAPAPAPAREPMATLSFENMTAQILDGMKIKLHAAGTEGSRHEANPSR